MQSKSNKQEIKEDFSLRTRIIKIDNIASAKSKLLPAAKALKEGKLVAFPTETVYGLGSNALDKEAAKKIFIAKGRPADNPFIVHIADKKDLYPLVESVPKIAEKLIDKFWPGPLTIILKKSEIVPIETTGGRKTVAIRMPSHPVALELIREAGVPVAAPSANISSRPSGTTAKHVIEDLKGRVDFIIDGGDSEIGVESTVVDLTSKTPMILRPGKISLEDLKKVAKNVSLYKAVNQEALVAKSPGMKYRHYSPTAKVIIVEGNSAKVDSKIKELVKLFLSENKKVKVLSSKKRKGNEYYFMGSSNESFARNLFKAFRDLDEEKTDIIIAESVAEKGIGLAVMNRMKKASYKVIKV